MVSNSTPNSALIHGWDIPRSGSLDMDNYKAARNVWGTDDAFLSPPDCGPSLATSLDSEESSEKCDDYLSCLAEEIAQSMLREEEPAAHEEAFKIDAWPKPAWGIYKGQKSSSPSSPQSTLAGFNWESQGNRSSSGVTSPPTPQEGGEVVDVFFGDLLRVKLEDELIKDDQQRHTLSLQQQIIQRPSRSTSTSNVKHGRPSHHVQSSTLSSASKGRVHTGRDNVLSMAIDKAMMVKEGRHLQLGKGTGPEAGVPRGRKGAGGGGKRALEQQQRQQFSLFASNKSGVGPAGRKDTEGGLRAVFLGMPSSRECGGTGVFLPRSSHQNSRRKQACSTVLLPSHIVQALNLNVEDTLRSSQRKDLFSSLLHYQCSMPVGVRRSEVKEDGSHCSLLGSHPTTLQEIAPNISLPIEWTY